MNNNFFNLLISSFYSILFVIFSIFITVDGVSQSTFEIGTGAIQPFINKKSMSQKTQNTVLQTYSLGFKKIIPLKNNFSLRAGISLLTHQYQYSSVSQSYTHQNNDIKKTALDNDIKLFALDANIPFLLFFKHKKLSYHAGFLVDLNVFYLDMGGYKYYLQPAGSSDMYFKNDHLLFNNKIDKSYLSSFLLIDFGTTYHITEKCEIDLRFNIGNDNRFVMLNVCYLFKKKKNKE